MFVMETLEVVQRDITLLQTWAVTAVSMDTEGGVAYLRAIPLLHSLPTYLFMINIHCYGNI